MKLETKKTQVVVIGAGPGGYAAAFYAADCGLEVTLIDKRKNPGGVCLYEGCIPSKAFLHAASVVEESKLATQMGIKFSEPKIDVDKLRSWKNGVIEKLTGGLQGLAKKRGIQYIQATATFATSFTLNVKSLDQEYELEFEHAVIATGSEPIKIKEWPESKLIMDSTRALELDEIPKRMLVVGGGYIGLEMSQFHSVLGSSITIVEMADRLVPGIDADLIHVLEKEIKNKIQKILLNTRVVSMKEKGSSIEVEFQIGEDEKTKFELYDRVLVSIGRRVDVKKICIENTSVKITDRGYIQTDLQCRTSEKNIFAIGDVVGGVMLAHKASHEGRVAVDAILGKKTTFEPRAIPAVVFTNPEIATAGLSEDEAKRANTPIKVVKFPFAASGRALTLLNTDGFVKLIVHPKTGRVLGAGIVGPSAGELIAEVTLAIEMGAVAEDIALTIHAHPTLSETVMEASENFLGHSTHMFTGRGKSI